jgi:hypothetical protein
VVVGALPRELTQLSPHFIAVAVKMEW